MSDLSSALNRAAGGGTRRAKLEVPVAGRVTSPA